MKFSVAAVALLLAFPADGHCYSIWRYPWRQQCEERVAQQNPPTPPDKPVMLPPFTISPLKTIILTPRPGRTDEEGREDALKILREVMGK